MDARIIHILHDEVLVEARDNITEKVKRVVKKCLESGMEKMVLEVSFKVEPEIRVTWVQPSDAL